MTEQDSRTIRTRNHRRVRIVVPWVLSACFLTAGCAAPRPEGGREELANALHSSIGHGLPPEHAEESFRIPDDVTLGDGLSVDEAVALALWNNPEFATAIAELGVGHARVIEAGLLPNPILSLLFPIGPKDLESTLTVAIDALWKRPRRVAIAEGQLAALVKSLVEGGVSLAGTVKVSFHETAHATTSLELLREEQAIRERLVRFSEARLRAGEISPLEHEENRSAALATSLEVAELEFRLDALRRNLREILGFPREDRTRIDLSSPTPGPDEIAWPEEELIHAALTSRADLQAAALAVSAAAERVGLARQEILSLALILDLNDAGGEDPEVGPGLALELPVFDQGKGRNALARAELERASRAYRALRQTIPWEVAGAVEEVRRARAIHEQIRDVLLVNARKIEGRIRRSLAAGELTQRDLLEAELQVLRIEESRLLALRDRHIAIARLEEKIGRRLDTIRPASRTRTDTEEIDS